MTLVEIKKAAQELSEIEKKELIIFLGAIDGDDYQITAERSSLLMN